MVEGTDFAPDDLSMKELDAIIERFAEVEMHALEFLRGKDDGLGKPEPEVCELDATDQPGCFTLQFVAKQDRKRAWWVQCNQIKPIASGAYDD